MIQWLRLWAPSAGRLDSIPGQGIRSHMLQTRVHMLQCRLKILHTEMKKKKISSRFLLCFFEYFLGAHPYMSPVLPAACNALLFKWLYQEVWRYTFGKRAYCHKSLNWGLQWKAQQGKFSYFPLETLQLVSISKAFFFFSRHRGKTIALNILVLLLNL